MKWLILVFTSIIIGASTCKKNDCIRTENTFQIVASAYPNNDSINKNDTIWFEVVSQKTFIDINTSQSVSFERAVNFGTNFSMDKFIGGSFSSPTTIHAANSFEQKIIDGTETQSTVPDRIKSYYFKETSSLYSLKIGFVAKDTGIFVISIANPIKVYTELNQCGTANFLLPLSNTNKHLYFFNYYSPGYVVTGLEATNSYCFKVK